MNLLSADISRSLGSFCVLSYRYKIRAEAIQAVTEYIDILQTTMYVGSSELSNTRYI
jgi:hypothetical protein